MIGVGRHGMMRMQSGDWSDLIMSRVGIKYNSERATETPSTSLRGTFFLLFCALFCSFVLFLCCFCAKSDEFHSSLNAAMASRVFDRWAEALKMAQVKMLFSVDLHRDYLEK